MMVVQQGTEPATDTEWRAFMADLSQKDLSQLRVLILTTGGGPTADQRVQLKHFMAGRSVRTAVVSDSIKMRFIIATIALINREHHGFTNRELGKAYEFLELTPTERTAAARAIKELARQLA
ncbi:MAG: hypothetical protein WDO69_13925 [Pseudomonadota bacterium]